MEKIKFEHKPIQKKIQGYRLFSKKLYDDENVKNT